MNANGSPYHRLPWCDQGGNCLYIRTVPAGDRQPRLTENPFTCPHGRPTMIRFTRPELDVMQADVKEVVIIIDLLIAEK